MNLRRKGVREVVVEAIVPEVQATPEEVFEKLTQTFDDWVEENLRVNREIENNKVIYGNHLMPLLSALEHAAPGIKYQVERKESWPRVRLYIYVDFGDREKVRIVRNTVDEYRHILQKVRCEIDVRSIHEVTPDDSS